MITKIQMSCKEQRITTRALLAFQHMMTNLCNWYELDYGGCFSSYIVVICPNVEDLILSYSELLAMCKSVKSVNIKPNPHDLNSLSMRYKNADTFNCSIYAEKKITGNGDFVYKYMSIIMFVLEKSHYCIDTIVQREYRMEPMTSEISKYNLIIRDKPMQNKKNNKEWNLILKKIDHDPWDGTGNILHNLCYNIT